MFVHHTLYVAVRMNYLRLIVFLLTSHFCARYSWRLVLVSTSVVSSFLINLLVSAPKTKHLRMTNIEFAISCFLLHKVAFQHPTALLARTLSRLYLFYRKFYLNLCSFHTPLLTQNSPASYTQIFCLLVLFSIPFKHISVFMSVTPV